MWVYVLMVEGELHRVFATRELVERYMQSLQEEYPDTDMYFVNMDVETK